MTSTSTFHTRHTLALEAGNQPAADIVAREGSELASQLRACGWVARAGWRARQGGWLLRFAPPTPTMAAQATDLTPTHTHTVYMMERQELAIAC